MKIHAACDGWLADCWYGGAEAEAEAPGKWAGDSGNPFGAVAAACIASGEVFKHAGGAGRSAERPRPSARFSMYDLRRHDARGAAPANPPLPDRIGIGSLAVFGCGAVGHAFCQCLDMIPGASVDLLLVDRSMDGGQRDEVIDGTNLARYVMCTNADLGRPKAEALASALHGHRGVAVSHTDGGICETAGSARPGHLENAVSCVDNNAARHEIQDLRPSRTYGGSVFEMQSQVSVYDAAAGTQCLKCNNPLGEEQGRGAAARRARGRAPPDALGAAQGPPPPHTAPCRLAKGAGCGTLSSEPHSGIPRLVGADFSVNFATAFSGAVLAAEIVKRSCSSMAPALDCRPNTDMFYSFWSGRPHLTTTAPRAECCGRITPAQVCQRSARVSPFPQTPQVAAAAAPELLAAAGSSARRAGPG